MMEPFLGLTPPSIPISFIVAVIAVFLAWFIDRQRGVTNQTNRPRLTAHIGRSLQGCFPYLMLFLIAFVVAVSVFLLLPIIIARGQGGPPAEPTPSIPPTPTNQDVEIKTISLGDTEPFHNEELFVGINTMGFDHVTFTVGSPGLESTQNTSGSTGYSFIYPDPYRYSDPKYVKYDVRVTKINYDSLMQNMTVEFTVTKLDN